MQKSKTLTLPEIFNDGSNCFEVPDYQRAYSWESEQRADLMADIEATIKLPSYKHFAGTIVAREKKTVGVLTYFDIVDGQQRLTSLLILLSVLAQRDFLKKETNTSINDTFLLRGKETGNTIRQFKLNGELDKYFHRKLEQWDYTSEEHTTKAHTNLDNAFAEFNTWLEESVKKDAQFAANVYSTILERILFLFHVPETSAELGLMFEVINNRGKKLSELEKIKNYLIYYAEKSGYTDIYTAVANNWGKILFNLNACGQTSNEAEDTFLRYTWIVFEQTNKAESYHVYDNLKCRFPAQRNSNWQRLKNYIEFIAESAETYNKLITQNLISNPREKKIIQQIFFQSSTGSITPLLLSIYAKVKNSAERIELLSLLEKLNFRYYSCGVASRSDTGNGYLFGRAHDFFNNYGSNGYTTSWLSDDLKNFIHQNCGDESFIKALTLAKDESGNFYHWNNLKYFLANYEEDIANSSSEGEDFTRFLLAQNIEKKNDNFEKEHILAINECTALTEKEDVNKRRLGNFVLLRPSLNKSIQDAPLYQKLMEYNGNSHKYLTPRSLAEIRILYGPENVDKGPAVYTADFLIDFLDRREEKLINFALDRWGLGSSKKVHVNSKSDEMKIYRYEE